MRHWRAKPVTGYTRPSIMEPSIDETARPDRVGPYRLAEAVGRGGMGTVWRAWDERLERLVAVKQVRTDTGVAELRQRLRREARTAARLNHPAIVHIYDLVEDPGGDWIVMELVEGRTLRRLIQEEGRLPFAQAVRLALDVSEGLAEAHSQDVLHRDLKAANVMVTPAGRAKILDFGLAKLLPREAREGAAGEDQEASLSTPGMVLGTAYAMSPEQVLGRPLDARSDLFALGSLLYEMLAGEPPFRAATLAASLAAIVSFHPPPLGEAVPGVPRELSDLVGRLLEKDCRFRPESAREVAGALAGLSGAPAMEDPQSSTVAEPMPARPSSWTGASAPDEKSRRSLSNLSPDGGRRRTIGEHRLLTVVCCALVRCDEASGAVSFLEPEELAEAMAALRSLAGEVCQRFAGRSGAALGSRLWLYFGHPQAREDDARRAVQAARELIARHAEIGAISPGLSPWTPWRPALRIAVHTGHAVVSIRPGEEEALEPGPLLDVTAGLQELASAGEILVTAASLPLLARAFATEDLPAVRLPGAAEPVAVSRVLGEIDPRQEGDDPLTPLVGRERDLELLLERYRLARAGTGQAVMIGGEPGIGKSRLLKDLQERLAAEGAAFRIAYGSLAAQGSPLAPFLDLLERTIFDAETADPTDPERKLHRLADFLAAHGAAPAETVPLLAPLLGLASESRFPARGAHPQFERKKLFEALVALFAEMAERGPLVLVVEDLHWADPSTLELLGLLLDEIAASPLLLVATFRPEFQAPWGHRADVTQLNLSRLTETQATALIDQLIERMADQRTGAEPLPDGLRQQILARTDGVPLFLEELTKALLETGRPGAPAEIPATLGGSLTARLDRPGPAKEVAQIASVLGRTFSLDLLTAVAPLDAAALEEGLEELIHAELIHRRGTGPKARYSFKHALIQDAAYASLLSRDRQALHLKIAQALEAGPAEAGLLAHHWGKAVSPRSPEPALVRRAVPRLLAAGEHTLRLGAYQEARAHLEAALALARTLPEEIERDEQELPLLVLLCRTLQASLGYVSPEVERVYAQARELRLRLGDRREISQILYMLWVSRLFEGEHGQALELAQEWLDGAEKSGRGYLAAHGAMSHSLYCLGRLPECLRHAEMVLAAPPAEQEEQDGTLMDYGLPPRVGAAYYSSWALVHLGMEREALARHELAVALAEQYADPFGMAMALGASLTFHIRRHDLTAVLRTAERMKSQAVELGIPGEESLANRALSWARAESGDPAALHDFLAKSTSRRQRVNGKLERGWACHQIGVLFLRLGRLEEAGAVIEKGLAAARHGEFLIAAHLGCLKGELYLAQNRPADAETLLREAFALACQGLQPPVARRAAALLAPLLTSQERHAEAAELDARLEALQAEVAEQVQAIFAAAGRSTDKHKETRT
jgi:serine/threonine protein kinase/tetratricopeptide (TPR) repeat protein